MNRRTTPDKHAGPPLAGPYSPTATIGRLIAVAGQAGLDPETGAVVSDDVGEQTAQALQNISDVLAVAGSSLDDVLSVRVFLADLADFDAMNEVYRRYFAEPYPARATVSVGLPATMKIEIEAFAVKGDAPK